MRALVYGLAILLSVACVSSYALAQDKSSADSNAATAETTLQYMKEGSAFYLKGEYKKAIKPYQKALDLEKQTPTLSKTLWRVLIDNLSMSYGISGDLKKSKETLEYGLSKDSTYPMFHYIMACTYAEMNDKAQAITYLKSAFKYKDNVIEGEEMPDPATDDSFQRYMKDEEFLNALKEIKEQ